MLARSIIVEVAYSAAFRTRMLDIRPTASRN